MLVYLCANLFNIKFYFGGHIIGTSTANKYVSVYIVNTLSVSFISEECNL